ncbi:DJ-1 protein-PfpI domain-containing protein [Mycena sanguinolenta]|uniref:DJ-1 protein-PfpI domain-containing protein n=1 Tax=Mycena sanguinolenta TaxID=230812 RepID=A0A8H7D9C2_9AGAR|nr:DJ-1 protein-PfpI domain-containing protein [Mycena sanguinolenta]
MSNYHSPLLSSAASISSFQVRFLDPLLSLFFLSGSDLQSFDTIRQAPRTSDTPGTSIASSDDHRWSEVVPPEGGLTFAVVWDPEQKDILTFSTPELSQSNSRRSVQSPDSPTDAFDNRSQVLTIAPSIVPTAGTATPATMQYFRQNHDFLFTDPKFFPDRPARGRTQTSSTLDGLDVYLRGSMLAKAHNANRYYSCFQELDGDFAFDPCTSFAHMWMEGMKELTGDDRSRFSGTTTSTSNFVTVENEMDDEASADWSALEAPNTPGYSNLFFAAPPSSQRRLRKNRPPASPSDVLDRPEYSHNLPLPTSPNTSRAQTPTPTRSQTLPLPAHPPPAYPLPRAQPSQNRPHSHGQVEKARARRVGLDQRQGKITGIFIPIAP